MQHDQPPGHLAVPSSGKGRPVLVLHAWWGLNDTMKTVCDQLAEAGFVAFAPDLYHGKVADNIADAEALGSALDASVDQARVEIASAVIFLRERADANDRGIAVIGFSLGASYAIDLSVADPEHVHSVVLFYGTGPADFSRSKAAYLGHFAANDPYEPKANVDGLEAALRQHRRPVEFYSYPETGHWFFEPDRSDAFNESAAKVAWQRTLDFLRRPFTS